MKNSTKSMTDLFDARAERGQPRDADETLQIARQMAPLLAASQTKTIIRPYRKPAIAAACVAVGAVGAVGYNFAAEEQPVELITDAAGTEAADADNRPAATTTTTATTTAAAPASSQPEPVGEKNNLAGDFLDDEGRLRTLVIDIPGIDVEQIYHSQYIDGSLISDYLPHDQDTTPEGDVIYAASYVMAPGDVELGVTSDADRADGDAAEYGESGTVSTRTIGSVDVSIVASEPYVPLPDLFSDQERQDITSMSDEEARSFVEQRIVENGGELNIEDGGELYHEVTTSDAPALAEGSTVGPATFEADTDWAEFLQVSPPTFTAVWQVDGVSFRLQDLASEEELVAIIEHLRPVDEAEFLATYPKMVGPDQLGSVVAEALAGVTLPEGLTEAALADTVVTPVDRGDVARTVVSGAICGWISEWVEAGRAGDDARTDAAVSAVESVPTWPVVADDFADDIHIVEQADKFATAMAGDGMLRDDLPLEDYYRTSFGC